MKLNKKYKLNLLILLCLIIILILIYLKHKKIDLFSISINPYSINKYLKAQELKNELQNQINEQEIKIKHLTEDTQIVLNGGIIPLRTTTIQPTTTTQPTTANYIPMINAVDSEKIAEAKTDTTTPTNTTTPTDIFFIPFNQPTNPPVTINQAEFKCSTDFNNINNNCKIYTSVNPDVDNNYFTFHLKDCISDYFDSNNPYVVKEKIDELNKLCNEREDSEKSDLNLLKYF